jgi:hypothetical protein
MRQGRILRVARGTMTAALLAALVGVGHAAVRAPAAKPRVESAATKPADAPSRGKRAANALRQFTGYVSAIDKTSITVEKRGKKPETRVFTKLDDMRTTGDVDKDARVTVYYRDDGGKAVAHRVVVKAARSSSKSRS